VVEAYLADECNLAKHIVDKICGLGRVYWGVSYQIPQTDLAIFLEWG